MVLREMLAEMQFADETLVDDIVQGLLAVKVCYPQISSQPRSPSRTMETHAAKSNKRPS